MSSKKGRGRRDNIPADYGTVPGKKGSTDVNKAGIDGWDEVTWLGGLKGLRERGGDGGRREIGLGD
jgi:hypothetical protein